MRPKDASGRERIAQEGSSGVREANHAEVLSGIFENGTNVSPLLRIEATVVRGPARKILGFEHDLHRLGLFHHESSRALAVLYADRAYLVATGAASPHEDSYSVASDGMHSMRALELLETSSVRVRLKRQERHDTRFRRLFDDLVAIVTELRGGFDSERVFRLDSTVSIGSTAEITRHHVDPEMTVFAQVFGVLPRRNPMRGRV